MLADLLVIITLFLILILIIFTIIYNVKNNNMKKDLHKYRLEKLLVLKQVCEDIINKVISYEEGRSLILEIEDELARLD